MLFKKATAALLTAAIALTFTSCSQTEEEVYNYPMSNENVTEATQKVYNYICETYGSAIISGQQESTWMGSPDYEMDYIYEKTGKFPAIRGLDYINNDFDGVNERAVEWWEKGGLVSICWHWGTPPDGVGYESSKGTIDLDEALTEGTDLYNGMIEQMDRAAEALLELQEAGVVVIWRPFHEFDGEWFWWGKGGSENFKKLWQLMYDRYTNYFGLNNLIWVLGYSHRLQPDWAPDSSFYDIGGGDCYDGGTQSGRYQRLIAYLGEDIPLAYHECGAIPDPDELVAENTDWVWFLTWHTSYITDENSAEFIDKVYNHDYVITLDELPSFV